MTGPRWTIEQEDGTDILTYGKWSLADFVLYGPEAPDWQDCDTGAPAYEALVGAVRDAELLPAALDIIRRLLADSPRGVVDRWVPITWAQPRYEQWTWVPVDVDGVRLDPEIPVVHMSDDERAVFDLLTEEAGEDR